MGAWGYRVFDNDDACGFMIGIETPIKKLLKKHNTYQYEYNELRAAAETIIKLSPTYTFDPEEILEIVIEKLQYIMGDQSWLANWDNKAAIKRSLKKQMQELIKINTKTRKKLGLK